MKSSSSKNSDHQKTQEKLLESENNLRALFSAMTDIVIELDYNGKYIDIAPTSPQLLFKPSNDTIGKTLHQVFPKPQADLFLKFIRKSLDENKTNIIEYPLVIDNKTIWFEGRGTPKSKNSIIFIARDITERKKAEEKLQESEKKFRTIFENINIATGILSKDGCIRDCNSNFVELSGYKKSDIIDKMKWSDFVVKEDLERLQQHHSQCLEQDAPPTQYECSIINNNGKILYIIANISMMGSTQILSLTDITDRKKSEKNIQQNNAKHLSIFARISDVVGIMTSDCVIKYKSPNIEKLFGWKPEDLIGKDIWGTVHPEDIDSLKKEFSTILEKSNAETTLEYRYKCKDNTYKWIVLTALNCIEDININGILLNYHDITKRKQVEEALRDSELRFKALHNASFGGIAIHNKGLILDCNKGLSEITGYSNEELVSMDGLLLISDDTRELVVSNIMSGYEKPYEVIGVRKNGERYSLRIESRNIPYKGEKVRVVEFRDITESKRAEDALRESEEKFRTMTEQISEMIYLTDSKGIIKYISPASVLIFGYSPQEMEGKRFTKFLKKSEIPKAMKAFMNSIISGSQTIDLHLIMKHKNGSNFYGELSGQKYESESLKGTIGVIRDISARKIAEMKIESALREKEILLKEIHHRVKNNLAVLSSLINLQSKKIQTKEQALDAFMNSRDRIHAIASVHESFYRSDDFSTIDLQSYVKKLVKDLVRIYQGTVEITQDLHIADITIDLNRAVPCGLLLNEVVTNALKHAFKDNKKGCLTINLDTIENERVCLLVQDDGVGLPEQFISGKSGSLGMELISVLTKQLDGELTIKVENGTAFSITFPMHDV